MATCQRRMAEVELFRSSKTYHRHSRERGKPDFGHAHVCEVWVPRVRGDDDQNFLCRHTLSDQLVINRIQQRLE
jgi:hypothetical protein